MDTLVLNIIVLFFFISKNVHCVPNLSDNQNVSERSVFSYLFGETCPACRCGSPNRGKRLLGGEVTLPHEFRWLVQINLRGLEDVSGTLISDRYVLTAASPLVGVTPYEVKVTMGKHDRCKPDVTEITFSVEEIHMHADFGPSRRSHDIALLRLSNRITFDSRISPICLPSKSGNSYLGQVGTIVAWIGGVPADARQTVPPEQADSCEPRKLGLPILGGTECPGITSFQGCVGVVGTPSIICKRDAGSAVQYRNYEGVYEIVGVLTDLADCRPIPIESAEGPTNGMAVFTRVTDHLDWILGITKRTCFCHNKSISIF